MTYEELYHHGVLGMKWGVRHDRTSSGGNRQSRKERKAEEKAKKDLKRRQDEYDKNVEQNWTKAWNNAADRIEQEFLPKLNKKYENIDFSNDKDPKIKAAYEKYLNEYDTKWNQILEQEYDKMFGKRPE